MSAIEFEIRPAGGDTGTPLNLAKRLRLLERFGAPLAERRFLDCGCGSGEYVAALTARGVDAHGIEYDTAKVEAAHRESAEMVDRVAQGDLESIAHPDAAFDLALLNEVLEHVPDERRALAEVHRVLALGGRLIVFSPSRLYPFETHGVAWRKSGRRLPPATPFVPWLPVALGTRIFAYWARNYWPWELRRQVRAAGFCIVATTYTWQTFENISGRQPRLLGGLRPILRRVAELCERLPLVRTFGVSQVIVAEKV